MGTKLYVGNLNYNTSEESLRQLFAGNGREVASVSIIMDRETGRSRGFAFVEMATPEGAQDAMRELDGHDLDGRQLRINEARERDPRGPRPAGGGGFSRGPRPGGFAGGGGGFGGGGGGFGGGPGGGGFGGGPPGGGLGGPPAPGSERQRTFGPDSPPGGRPRGPSGKKSGERGREDDDRGKKGRRGRNDDDGGW